MRARVMALLLVAVSTVSLHSHAETAFTVVAANRSGQAIAFSTSRNTFVVKATATSLPVKGKLTCLQIERFGSGVGVGPLVVPLSGTDFRASVKAGGVTYYVIFQSFGRGKDTHRQVITVLGVRTTFSANTPCGVYPRLQDAAGIAIYG